MDRPNTCTHCIANDSCVCKYHFVSSCWHNSVSKIVIKSVAVRTRRKAVKTLKELYFSKEPHLQAHSDELKKQEFPRA